MPSAIRIDFPTAAGPLAWSGANDKVQDHYTVEINDADKAECKMALESWKDGMNGAPASVSKQTFPLTGRLASRLEDLSLNLHKGSGFAVIRGLDTKEFSAEDNMLIYLGISSWVGSQRGMNPYTKPLCRTC